MTSEVDATYGGHFGAPRHAEGETCQGEVKRKTYDKLAEHHRRRGGVLSELGGERYLGACSAADAHLRVLTRGIGLTPPKLADYPAFEAYRARLERDEGVRKGPRAQRMAG